METTVWSQYQIRLSSTFRKHVLNYQPGMESKVLCEFDEITLENELQKAQREWPEAKYFKIWQHGIHMKGDFEYLPTFASRQLKMKRMLAM